MDSDLTENGVSQAKAAGEALKKVHFDIVFASDLSRAKRTAEYIVAERKLVVNTTKLLRERRFGKYEGKPGKEYREENKELFEKMEKMSEKEKRRVKFDIGYENEEDLAARLLIFLREIAATYLGKTVLAVSHGGAMRALLMHLGFASFDELRGKSIENTAHIKLESDGVDFFIKETKGINKQKVDK